MKLRARTAVVIVPRTTIGVLMEVVAIVALNFSMIRAVYHSVIHSSASTGDHVPLQTALLLLLGALPTANVLAIGVLIGLQNRAYRPFLLGFVIFGTISLITCICIIYLRPNEMMRYSFFLFIQFFMDSSGPRWYRVGWAITAPTTGVSVLVLPQIALALLGGFLYQRLMARGG